MLTEPEVPTDPPSNIVKIEEGLTVCGMDPSSFRNCGWGVLRYQNGTPVLLEKFTQVIESPEDIPWENIGRFREIYNEFARMIDQHGVKVLCVERSMGFGMAFVRNNLSETVGVVKLCCHDKKVLVHESSPAHLKKIIAGHGKAKKKDIKANVVATFGLKKAGPEHECDAVALALAYMIDAGMTGYTVKVPFKA